ncbi:uncharacterized protein LOC110114433 [Dendrobium catenatum]|uniref:Uncharacterized protein n=1 Tax=Dendrobium catenatum TaxID=906689 RepID=A0A2I0WI12_9ASPA|nr:uncharacterized protein LOC110114433 [Dendrobium catenatum]PKU75300.1 hypothetical protein MA16_Dca022103 [Dendrobium catenatum]
MAGRKREWLRKKMMGRKEQRQWAVNGNVGSLSSAWRRWRQNRRSLLSEPFIQRVIFDRCVFYLMYAVEAVVLIASFCYFYLRFGFRL